MYGLNYMGIDWSYMVFVMPALLLAVYAQGKIQTEYSKYSRVSNQTGLTGAEIARIILDRNGLNDVRIERVAGKLSDHYDPRSKVVRLSTEIYSGSSIASMSVAAHECGHAMQHAEEYAPLNFRSALVPVVNIASKFTWILIIIGMLLTSNTLVKVGIITFSLAVLFQIVTLPVEFNASRRALIQLENGIAPSSTLSGSKQVLKAAAMTYVASTVMAIGQLLRLLVITGNTRNRDN